MVASIIADTVALKQKQRETHVRTTRPTVRGVGINDSPTPVKVNGKNIPPYIAWQNMIGRCYSKTLQVSQPTYVGCTVVDEWHYFSNFERWYSENYFDGAHLDKDILFPGNRVYGPGTCIFATLELNALLSSNAAVRGLYPLGVSADGQRFRAQVNVNSRHVNLGNYDTPLLAHQAWQTAKAYAIERFPATDPRIRAALDRRVAQLRDDLLHGRITVSL